MKKFTETIAAAALALTLSAGLAACSDGETIYSAGNGQDTPAPVTEADTDANDEAHAMAGKYLYAFPMQDGSIDYTPADISLEVRDDMTISVAIQGETYTDTLIEYPGFNMTISGYEVHAFTAPQIADIVIWGKSNAGMDDMVALYDTADNLYLYFFPEGSTTMLGIAMLAGNQSSASDAADASQESELSFQDVRIENATGTAVVSFPGTGAAFDQVGWKWSEKYADEVLPDGYYTSTGGTIGTYPESCTVSIFNLSGKDLAFKDCMIDSATFKNPKSDDVTITFFRGITFSSSLDEVKAAFSDQKNAMVSETPANDSTKASAWIKVYKDDNPANSKDWIKFTFYDGAMTMAEIHTDAVWLF